MASPSLTDTTAAPAVLQQARSLTVPALRQAIATLHPRLAQVAGYHCGLTDQHGRPAPARVGKMLRPALVFLSARSTGVPAERLASEGVVAGAVAVQLVHEFSLLHDDIMDRDRTRRGRPTAWAVHGVDTALLAGDALLALAVSTLAEHPQAEAVLAEAVVGLCAGQADDLAFETRTTVTVADWERMAIGKTGGLICAACQLGALLTEADSRAIAVLGTAGTQLGLAFQAMDDWLGIWGDPKVTGKPAGADVAARKRSLPIVVTLTDADPAAQRLAAILATDGELTTDDLAAATTALERTNAGQTTSRHARQHTDRARDAIAALTIPSDVRREWDHLISFLITRAT
ncbi:polyprenyl synthetase family protein [Amycolatopsis aidingensis]|uniref:polyprenyl synthetase family protein n=1 Tax=Amycolatopsis aidingensis TaxID=2842453 RepID=UPI001C0CDEC0|nr:polyprenyl synthetase family protein [Amycolatopsis aidingensis]